MKNQKTKFGQKVQYTFKGVCILALSFSLNNAMHSQNEKTKFGISATTSMSGQGFGAMYTPSLFYKLNDCKIELGLNIQKRKFNISGMQINFEYTLFDESKEYNNSCAGDLELFVYSTIKYNCNAYLSKSQINSEKMIVTDSKIPFDDLKFTALEAYIGFGLNVKLTERLKCCNSIGFGGWKTLKGERYLFRDYNGVSIMLTTGLALNF